MTYMAAMHIKATADAWIDLLMDGKALGHISLGPSEAEEFCQSVAECRKSLSDQVSTDLDHGSFRHDPHLTRRPSRAVHAYCRTVAWE
jgi:hypothetical protein